MSWFEGRPMWRQGRCVALSVVALGCIVACTTTDMGDRVDYRTATPPKPLEVPPELSQLPKDDRFQIPSANAAAAAAKAPRRQW